MKTFTIYFAVLALSSVIRAQNTFPTSGNVGVGTSAPEAQLDLGVTNGLKQLVYGGTNGYQSGFGINLGQSPNALSATIGGGTWNGYSSFEIVRPNQTSWPYSTYTTLFSVLSSGNVGIGTPTPQQRLQLGNSSYLAVMANSGNYVPTAWCRGNAGGLIFASSSQNDGTGWSYGSRIINNDYGDGLALSIDALFGGGWVNDALVVSGRNGNVGNVGIGTVNLAGKLTVEGQNQAGVRTYSGLGQRTSGVFNVYADINDSYYRYVDLAAIGDENNGRGSRIRFLTQGDGATQPVERLRINEAGNVGIGTTSPTEKLSVNGRIRAREVVVETTNWSDYILAKDHKLTPLSEVEQHIEKEGHLPGVP